MLPFPDEDEEEDGEEEAPRPDPNEQQRQAAKATMEDFTRNIQRKKESEMAELQFVGGDGSTAATPVVTRREDRAQRSLSLRQRQEIQEVPRGGVVEARLSHFRIWSTVAQALTSQCADPQPAL